MKMTRVLREPPFDRLRVVRELEPQDPEGNRGAKTQRMPRIFILHHSVLSPQHSLLIAHFEADPVARNSECDKVSEDEGRGIKYWLALNSKIKGRMSDHLPKKQNSNSST